MERAEILALAKRDPRFQQAADQLSARLAESGASPEMLDQIIQVVEHALENPEHYAPLRQKAIEDGLAREEDLPPEFNEQFLTVLLIALYDAEERLGAMPQEEQQQFACGGLAKHGRGGDTMLAHINSREAEVLRRMGGSGSVNPNTGVREFKGGGFGDILSIAAPIALDFIAPGLGSTIGGGMLASGMGAALGGGDIGKALVGGALGGGLGGVAGDVAGGWLGDTFGAELGKTATGALGNALVGGAGSALRGGNFAEGAATGALGSLAGNAIGGMGSGDGAFSQGVQQAGQTFGNALTAGYTPQQAAVGGGLAGLARGLQSRGYAGGEATPGSSGPVGRGGDGRTPTKVYEAMNADMPVGGGGFSTREMISAAPMVLTLLGGAQTPEEVQQAAAGMSPEQRAYFDRESQVWDWDQMQRDAAAQGMGLGSYMARNWNNVTGGKYVKPSAAPKFARGGPLSMLAQGGGTGRSDEIDAKLSDGEYVIDAETVALLGDGSTKAGAAALDQMRKEIRQHKGRALAHGRFSPDAMSPLAYIKETA